MNRFEQAVYECMNPTADLLARTENPLHRAILLNFWRHVHLEGSAQYEAITAPDMMVDHPVYRVSWGRQSGGDRGQGGRDRLLQQRRRGGVVEFGGLP